MLERTRDAVAFAMFDLNRMIVQEGRLRTITGAIYDRITTNVTSGTGFVTGQLETDDYWEFVGSGRGPGGQPPVDQIEAWLNRAGLSFLNPWAIAKKQAKEGTRDWRLKKPNVFTTAIDKWELEGLDHLEEVAGLDLEDASVDIVKQLGKHG